MIRRRRSRVHTTALAQLPDTRLVLRSPLYRTKPFGPVAQPDFVNAAAALLTQLPARELLAALQADGSASGPRRDRSCAGVRDASISICWCTATARIDEPGLSVPHPGLAERAFVLAPLADIAPDLRVPGLGLVRDLLAAIDAVARLAVLAGMSPRRSEDTGRDARSSPHRYIVVEGPIGVGKTSLARRLAKSFGSELVLEQGEHNPFLERFYRNPRAAAFQTQLYFLFQRSRQLQDLRQQDLFERMRVADYLLEKDRLFARLTLDEEEFALYEQVYSRLSLDAPQPDLVVYLQAPVDVLLARIARRGIAYEQGIERRYLERLVEAYSRFFLEYEAAPGADRQCGGDRSRRQRRRLQGAPRRESQRHRKRSSLLQPAQEPALRVEAVDRAR